MLILCLTVIFISFVSGMSNLTDIENNNECKQEHRNLFPPPLMGYLPSNCSYYDTPDARLWLPDPYLNNAKCACQVIPVCPSANCVREQVQVRHQDYLRYITPELKAQAQDLKASEHRHEYRKFVQTKMINFFHQLHIDAYAFCGCNSEPAPYWAWQAVGGNDILCALIRPSILIAGPCHGVRSFW